MNTEVFDLGKIGITLGGEYDNKVVYEKLTIVLYKGKSYISTKITQGVSPEQDIETWQLIAEAKDAYHMLVDAGKITITEEEFLEQLVDATKGRYVIQGNLVNAADEEDLTVEHSDLLGIDVLKFKNKKYDPLTFSGLGKKILRKNMVNGVNTLTQEMMSDQNIKYVIKYDYVLNEDIIIPKNCVLEFDGGSLNTNYNIYLKENDIIFGNNCSITINGTLYSNAFTKIIDLNIIRTAPLRDNESVVSFDDTYFPLTDDYGMGVANINSIIKNCKLILPVGIADKDVKGNAIEVVSRGLLQYKGYWGLTFDNIFINGIAEKAFYVWCADGWITDLLFTRCMVNGSKIGWSFAGNQIIQQISLTNCSMQYLDRSTYGIECDKVLWLHLTDCIFWDWHASPYTRYNFTENTQYVFINWAENEKPYSVNGDPKKVNRTVFITSSTGNRQLNNFINFSQDDIKLVDWYNIPDGTYIVSSNSSHGDKIGVMCNQGGTLIVGKGDKGKSYIYISNSQDSISNRAEMKVMSLLKPPSDDISLTQTAKSLWRRVLIGTDTIKGNIKIYDAKYNVDKYIECRSYDSAESENFPQVSSENICKLFFNTTYGQPAIQTRTNWKYLQTREAEIQTNVLPNWTNTTAYRGMYILYTGTIPNKPIWWLGNKWIEFDGVTIGVKRNGTFANKPDAKDIYIGFKYFCTDRQTIEGVTNGIEIIHKGNNVWVDALGRVIS